MSSASVKTKNIAEHLKKKDKRELNGGKFTWRCCSRYLEDQPYSVFAWIDGICVVWCLLYCHYPFFYSNSRFVYLYICIGVCVRVCFPSALFVCLPFCHCYYSHLPYLPLPLWAQVSWFVSERQHNRQQQCASNHSQHFFPLTWVREGREWCRCCGFVIPCFAVTDRIWSDGSRMWRKMNS